MSSIILTQIIIIILLVATVSTAVVYSDSSPITGGGTVKKSGGTLTLPFLFFLPLVPRFVIPAVRINSGFIHSLPFLLNPRSSQRVARHWNQLELPVALS